MAYVEENYDPVKHRKNAVRVVHSLFFFPLLTPIFAFAQKKKSLFCGHDAGVCANAVMVFCGLFLGLGTENVLQRIVSGPTKWADPYNILHALSYSVFG